MLSGCFPALITPFREGAVDYEGLSRLVDFQIANGVSGIVAVGTTGESPTLDWEDHNRVIEMIAGKTRGTLQCIAGTGSNNTAETLAATEQAVRSGAEAVLLVDPYYNGPSSLEIRREYIEPVATRFPDTRVIPYVVPGRTGAQLLPEDLALAHERYDNVDTVKEATADLDNMRRVRQCCGSDFGILSGDDNLTSRLMADPGIRACGVISVYANIFPRAMSEMVAAALTGEMNRAGALADQLAPLLELVTVNTTEVTPHGEVTCRARNPLPVKTLMAVLGMPAGGCRQPLGRMTAAGMDKLLAAARKVWKAAPEAYAPAADFFDLDVEARLNDPGELAELVYEEY